MEPHLEPQYGQCCSMFARLWTVGKERVEVYACCPVIHAVIVSLQERHGPVDEEKYGHSFKISDTLQPAHSPNTPARRIEPRTEISSSRGCVQAKEASCGAQQVTANYPTLAQIENPIIIQSSSPYQRRRQDSGPPQEGHCFFRSLGFSTSGLEHGIMPRQFYRVVGGLVLMQTLLQKSSFLVSRQATWRRSPWPRRKYTNSDVPVRGSYRSARWRRATFRCSAYLLRALQPLNQWPMSELRR